MNNFFSMNLFHLFLFFLFFPPQLLHAFTLNNNVEAVFYSRTVSLNLADTSCDHLGYSHEELLDLMGEAMNQYWNRVGSSRLRLRKGKIVRNTPTAYKTAALCTSASYQAGASCETNPIFIHEDNAILFVCNQNSLDFPASSGVLAATLPYIQGRFIKNSVILLNDTLGSQGNAIRRLSKQELLSLLAHEVGHGVGLGHSEVKESLMYYAVLSLREDLGRDDWDAVTYLYPYQEPLLGLGMGQCGSFLSYSHTDSHKNSTTPFRSITTFLALCLLGASCFSFLVFYRVFSFIGSSQKDH
jgi:hypothetical protein